MSRLKICGITRLEDARFASGALVDYLGFVFSTDSPRYISPRDAAEIAGWIQGPEKVGVFVNQSPEEINRIATQVGLDLVQLHGDETPEWADRIELPVIRAFRIGKDSTERINSYVQLWHSRVRFFLLDAYQAGAYGGTGKSWDWSVFSKLTLTRPFFLAGGLDTGNLEEAIRATHPFAVDLSSSLEEAPGKKDLDKMQLLFEYWNNRQPVD